MSDDRIKEIDDRMEEYKERIYASDLSAPQKVILIRLRTWEAEALKGKISRQRNQQSFIPQGFEEIDGYFSTLPPTSGFKAGDNLSVIIGYSNTGKSIYNNIIEDSKEYNRINKESIVCDGEGWV